MLPLLDQTFHSVPMLATLDVRTEAVKAGEVTLRLPVAPAISDHAGNLHTAAIFAVGELAASTVLGTHPELRTLHHLLKSSRVKYYASSPHDVTAHAHIPADVIAVLLEDLDREGTAEVDVLVGVLDPQGRDIAQLVSHFSLRAPKVP